MKKYFAVFLTGTALTLSACTHDMRLDTRGASFDQADADRDGRLTYGEYQDYLDGRVSQGDEEALKANSYEQANRPKAVLLKFQKLDANRDTFVTRDELGITP